MLILYVLLLLGQVLGIGNGLPELLRFSDEQAFAVAVYYGSGYEVGVGLIGFVKLHGGKHGSQLP